MGSTFLDRSFRSAAFMILAFCVAAIIGTIGYLLFDLHWPVMAAMIIGPFGLFFLTKSWPKITAPKTTYKYTGWLTLFFLILESALIINLVLMASTTPPPSPWQLVDWTFFWLFFTSTLLLLGLNFLFPTNRSLWLTSLHLLVMYSVTNLLYPLGFGFDGFIHRATEEWIKVHGFIIPKLPVYLGQYTTVVLLSKITTISIKTIDLWFVPVLAAFTLPRFIAPTLARVFAVPARHAINLTFVFTLIYFFALFLTTAYNILILLTILAVFTGLQYYESPTRPLLFLLGTMSVAGLCIHPLLGAPLSLFVAAFWIEKNTRYQKTLHIVYTTLMALLVPALFMAFLYFTRHIIPTFVNPFSKLDLFLQYFRAPYWYKHPAAWYWDALYIWEWLIPVVALSFGIFGYYYFKTKRAPLFFYTAIGLTISSFLLRTLVVFPDVHATEQGDYPLRLLKGALLFLLPYIMVGFWQTDNFLATCAAKCKNFRLHYISLLFIFAGAITVSWYLSYPQWNPKVQFPGYNVSATDFEVVTWIHDQNPAYNYVVLTNPVTAIAALEKYSFAKYFKINDTYLSYYSIPTGGPLYDLYTEMWTDGQRRETMEKAMNLVGADKAYFIIPSYWTKFNSIVEGAKKSANSWQAFNNEQIYVFTYQKTK